MQKPKKHPCPLCGGRAETFARFQERIYYKCGFCAGVFLERKYHLPPAREKMRYLEHNNDIHDPGYRDFVRPLVSRVLEKFSPDFVFGIESIAGKDSMHFRHSGLNQVLCKLAESKKTIIAISLKQINDSKEKSKLLGRIIQNIRLCRKYKVTQAIVSFAQHPYEMKSATDLISLGISLGMNVSDAKNSLNSVYEKILFNLKKKSPSYIEEGIEIIE